MKSVLVATLNEDAHRDLKQSLGADYSVESVRDREACLAKFIEKRYEFLFIDVSILEPGGKPTVKGYMEAFKPFHNAFPTSQIIVLATPEHIRNAVRAVKAGALDYLTYPINSEEVTMVTENVDETVRFQHELEYLRDEFWKSESRRIVQTLSPDMKKVLEKVRSVAPTKSTVLLTGETGTGKGLLAGLIHLHSIRNNNQFISVHCGAIPDTLIESELFGHEKGAFTGAVKRKLGKFEIAHGGTIFLDEIGTITPAIQIKLLQVLQDGIYQRVGGETELKSDVRVIAATNEDIEELIDNGSFRKDLYYRLNVFPIKVPSLRDRIEDIPFLVDGFLEELNLYNSKEINSIHPAVLEAFRNYKWPGNIRELQNILERAYILEQSSVLSPESFPAEIMSEGESSTQIPLDTSMSLADVRRLAIDNVERKYLTDILEQNKGRIGATAASARITTRQLRNLLKKYGIRKEEFK